MGITGNKAFIAAARVFGLRFGVKLSNSKGAQINFHRGGAGTPGAGDTVPAVGFTRRLLGEILTVENPKDGFRAETLLPRLWVVLDGEDVIKLSKKGVTVTGANESPFQIDNYDDEDNQQSSTELRLINYHNTPSNIMSFKTSRGTSTTPSILSAGDQIGITKWYGYKAAAYEIAAQIEVLADTAYGTNADGKMQIKLNKGGAFTTVLDMNGDGITTIGDINGALTLRNTYTIIGAYHYYKNFNTWPESIFQRADGTEASPTNCSDGELIGVTSYKGRIAGSYIDTAQIRCSLIESDTGESKLQLRVCGSGGSVADSFEVYPEGASVSSTLAYNIGSPTVNDSWRIRIESNDLVFERRESAVWVEKSRIEM